MLIITFENFINKYNIKKEAMSNIDRERKGSDISVTLIEIVMRDQIS